MGAEPTPERSSAKKRKPTTRTRTLKDMLNTEASKQMKTATKPAEVKANPENENLSPNKDTAVQPKSTIRATLAASKTTDSG